MFLGQVIVHSVCVCMFLGQVTVHCPVEQRSSCSSTLDVLCSLVGRSDGNTPQFNTNDGLISVICDGLISLVSDGLISVISDGLISQLLGMD